MKIIIAICFDKVHRYCFDVIYKQDHVITKTDRLFIWFNNLLHSVYPKFRADLYRHDKIKYARYFVK